MRVRSKLGIGIFAALFILVAVAYYYVIDGSIPKNSTFQFDLDEIRTLADAPEGELPTNINVEILAQTPVPYFALRAGGGFHTAFMTRSVFQIVTPDGDYALEAGMDLSLAKEYGQEHNFRQQAWLNIQKLLSGAKGIIVTHEHPDHIGGIARHPSPSDLVGSLVLTKEQFNSLSRFSPSGELQDVFSAYKPLDLKKPHAVAPGIVMVRAEGHTPGSVIVYVKLQSNTEFLFIGDIGYTASNIYDGVDRARFVRFLMVDPEDRRAVVHQLKALHDTSIAEPDMVIVPAHADNYLNQLISDGVFHEGFEFRPSD